MSKLNRTKESRAVRSVTVTASAVALIIVGAVAAGIVTETAKAAPSPHVAKASYHDRKSEFKRPNLRRGMLTVVGTKASETIALRLKAGQPGILQVDIGDDGLADFQFERDRIARIAVDARAGDDLVRVDEANGVFTDVISTTLDGDDGNDELDGGSGAELLLGGYGDDSIDGNRGNDLALLGAGDDTFVWDPGDGSDTVEGQAGTDTMLLQRRQRRRAGRPVGQRRAPALLPHPGHHHHGHQRRREGRLQRPRRPGHGDRQRPDRHRRRDRQRQPGRHPRRQHRRRRDRPASSSTAATAPTRSTSAEMPPVWPCPAWRRSWRFNTRSRTTSSPSTGSAATTGSPQPRSQLRRSPCGSTAAPADDTIAGAKGIEVAFGGDGNDSIDGTGPTMPPSSVPATTPSSGIQATAATPSRPGRHRHDAVQRRQRRRAGRPVGQRRAPALLPHPGHHHHGHERRRDGRLQRPRRRRTRSPSTT